MSDSCFAGRGLVLAREKGTDGPYLPLCGEGPVSFRYSEEVAVVSDYRFGVEQEVATRGKRRAIELETASGRVNKQNLALLVGSSQQQVIPGAVGLSRIFSSITIGGEYSLNLPNVASATVVDSTSATVPPTNYIVAKSGFIVFLDLTGFVGPYTVTFNIGPTTSQEFYIKNNTYVDLIVRGVNRVNNNNFVFTAYNAAISPAENFSIVEKGFTLLVPKIRLLADLTKQAGTELAPFGSFVEF